MRSSNLFRIIFACLLISGMAYAQGVGASGDIKGTVADPSGAVIANATVTATDPAKGTKRTAATDNNGDYYLVGLLPTAYNVSVAKAGFHSQIVKTLTVNIAQTVVLNFHI